MSYSSNEGIKHDGGKPRMELVPLGALMEVAKVLSFGAEKYGVGNWSKGMKWSRIMGALLRHTTAFQQGEDTDKETGLSHMAHAACCCLFLIGYQLYGVGEDDRTEVLDYIKKGG